MFNINNRPGQFFQTHKRRVVQRTATAVVLGDVMAIDTASVESETSNGDGVGGIAGLDEQDAIFHNLTEVHADNIDGIIVVVTGLLSGLGAENTEVEVTLCGQRVPTKVDGDSVDVAVGDRLIAIAGTGRALRVLVAATDGLDVNAVAYALQTETDATPSVRDVTFFGALPKTGAAGPGDAS